jgi:hypothetical protein
MYSKPRRTLLFSPFFKCVKSIARQKKKKKKSKNRNCIGTNGGEREIVKSHLFVLNRRTRLWKYYGLIRWSERAYLVFHSIYAAAPPHWSLSINTAHPDNSLWLPSLSPSHLIGYYMLWILVLCVRLCSWMRIKTPHRLRRTLPRKCFLFLFYWKLWSAIISASFVCRCLSALSSLSLSPSKWLLKSIPSKWVYATSSWVESDFRSRRESHGDLFVWLGQQSRESQGISCRRLKDGEEPTNKH